MSIDELREEAFAGLTAEQREAAEAAVERLSEAIRDLVEVFGVLFVSAMLNGLGPKLYRQAVSDGRAS